MFKKLEIREHAQGIFDLCETADGQVFTCSADGHVVSWNLEQGKQNQFVVRTSEPAYAMACSEKFLFLGLKNGDMHWIDLVNKQEVKFYTQHKHAIFSLLYDAETNRLYSSDAEGFVGVWDVTKLTLELFFQIPCGKIRTKALNNSSNILAIGGQDGVVYIFETEYFNEIHRFYAHQDGVTALAFHPNNMQLISGGKDAYLRIWNLEDYSKIKAFPAHLFAIYNIKFSPDNQFMASCSRDKTIKIWNSKDFSIQHKLDFKAGGHQHSVNSILWTKQGLISVSDDRRLIFWKM